MGEAVVAPSVPKNSNSLDVSAHDSPSILSGKNKVDNKGFFNKLFKKKKKEQEIKPPNQPDIKNLKKSEIKQEKEEHILTKINEIDKDIQINSKNDSARYSTLDSIENAHFNVSKDKKIDEDNIKQLRKALGLVKNKTEKIVKIEKFRDGLFDESTDEQEIVTNLTLEEKLGVKLDQPPSEEIQHLNLGVAIDTEVPEINLFRLSDGRQLLSLRDLRNSLENISDTVFSSHVFGRKNDFANWVKNIMKEPDLAKLIRKCKTKEALLSMLISLEKKEIEELIKIKQNEIVKEHKESLKNLDFLNTEREELNKEKRILHEEKSSIDELKEEFEKKIKELEEKEIKFKTDIEETKIEKLSYNKREEALENAKKDYLIAIKNQSEELSKIRRELLNQTQDYREKLEEDYTRRKKDLENEFNARFITLEKAIEEKKQQIKQDYESKFQRLDGEESHFRKEQSEINQLCHSKLEGLKVKEEEVFKLQKDFKEQELKLIKQESEVRTNLTALSKKLIEAKSKDEEVQSKIKFKKNLLFEIKQRELSLKKREEALEKGAFQKYLNSELRKMLDPNERIEIKDQNHEEDVAETYSEIEICRKILEKGNTKEAQAIYKQIRRNFYNLELDTDEREVLFSVIKELYADIQLKAV